MGKPEVWFAIPSANPAKCRQNLPAWRAMGYKIAVLQNFERGDIPADLVVWSDHYPGWPGSVNLLCRDIVPADCPIIVTGGDDMLPDPNHPAEVLAEQFFGRFPDTFGVMQPHGDEFLSARRYCGSPFLGRAWCSTMYDGAGPMYAGYHHNYADNELYWVASGLGVLWSRPDLSHFHSHFTRDGAAQPAYWNSVKKNDLRDCLLYYARAHERFPGHAPRGRVCKYRHPDDMTNMLILATQRLLIEGVYSPAAERITAALTTCAGAGQDSVAIYGFGLHTKLASIALSEPPVPIACIIDDVVANQGRRPWNIPIVSRAEALAMGVKAVVLSSEAIEDRLWANSEMFRAAGVPVYRLYGKAEPSAIPLPVAV